MPEVQMPKLSDTMTEGTLVAWKKKKGDQVSAGEVLAEIETDKATMEWESPEDGTLSEIYVEDGGKVNVGDKIAFIGGDGEEAPKEEKEKKPEAKEEEKEKPKEEETQKEEKPKAEKEKEEEKAKKEPEIEKKAEQRKEKKEEPVEAAAPAAPKPEKVEEARVRASPVARRVAAELGVDLWSVKGTGPEGRVTATDVRAAAKSKTVEAGVSPGAKQPTRLARQASETAPLQLSGRRQIICHGPGGNPGRSERGR